MTTATETKIKRIDKLRATGLTAAQAAKKVGLNVYTYYKYSAKTKPKTRTTKGIKRNKTEPTLISVPYETRTGEDRLREKVLQALYNIRATLTNVDKDKESTVYAFAEVKGTINGIVAMLEDNTPIHVQVNGGIGCGD